ncbi:MAG TPA: glycosyltransferase family 4 protein [Planctomycetota bacterium]|nr:glycosyltransferase family 4 protein [Planctomycetota bacterium]
MRITMLVANDLVYDGRVRKTAATAASAGHRVRVLGLATRGAEPGERELDGAELRVLPLGDPGRARLLASREALLRAKSACQASKGELRAAAEKAKRRRGKARGPAARLGRLLSERELARRRDAHERLVAESERARAAHEAEKARYRRHVEQTGGLDRFAYTWLPELLAAPPPDVVHVHDYHGLEAAFQAVEHRRRRGSRTRVVYDAHEYLAGREAANGTGRPWVVEAEARWAPLADAIVTVTPTIAAEFERRWSLARPPVVIYNLPARLNRSRSPARGLRALTGIGAHEPLVLYAGTSNERRGLDVLVRAAALVDDVRLVLVVPRPDEVHTRQVLDLARDLGTGDRVHVAPLAPLEEIVPYLAEADVGAYTPRDDGVNHAALPNKLFEYLHAGLGILVSDVGELGQFVRSTGVGVTHRPGDAHDCARALRRLLADPLRYRERRAELVDRWSWEAQEEKLLALYEELARPA